MYTTLLFRNPVLVTSLSLYLISCFIATSVSPRASGRRMWSTRCATWTWSTTTRASMLSRCLRRWSTPTRRPWANARSASTPSVSTGHPRTGRRGANGDHCPDSDWLLTLSKPWARICIAIYRESQWLELRLAPVPKPARCDWVWRRHLMLVHYVQYAQESWQIKWCYGTNICDHLSRFLENELESLIKAMFAVHPIFLFTPCIHTDLIVLCVGV